MMEYRMKMNAPGLMQRIANRGAGTDWTKYKLFIDISHWQGSFSKEDLLLLRSRGDGFVKLSKEGV